MRTLTTILCSLALCTATFAHGGIYNAPGDSAGAQGSAGGIVAPPTNPGGGTALAPGASAVSGGGAGSGVRTVRGGQVRGRGRDGGGAQSQGRADFGKDVTQWDLWWGANRDRFLDLRARLGQRNTVSQSSRLTGRGIRHRSEATTRPSLAHIEGAVTPALLRVLDTSDEADMLDSSVLALARMTEPGVSAHTSTIAGRLMAQLEHRELSVRSAAVLALGVLGDPDADDVLVHLAMDDSAGRSLVGGGAVGWLERAFAALGLGLAGHADHVQTLADLARRLPDSEADVKACAIIGLGLVEGAGQDAARTTLRELLVDRRLDATLKSYVPTALANLGDTGSVELLTEHFAQRDTDLVVLQSLAIALGRLADMDDEAWPLLGKYVDAGRDVQTRHFALIARAEIAARDAGARPDLQRDFVRALHDELDGDGKSQQHRPWAALAAAIWGRVPEHDSLDLLEHLRREYDDERDPLVRGAFAVSLGLLRDRASGERLTTDFVEQREPGLQAHLAVALGLMDHAPAAEVLRGALRGRTLPPHSRVEVALGLGLMGDPSSVPDLIAGLESAETLGLVAGHARALGLIGDGRAVEPLLAVIQDEGKPPMTRGFGCVALGMLCEKQPLPFNARIKMNNNYRAQLPSVAEVVDIL